MLGVGQREESAMTRKIITFEFVLPTAMVTTLAIVVSIVAVCLTDKYLGPKQTEAQAAVRQRPPEIAELPNPRLLRVRLLISRLE